MAKRVKKVEALPQPVKIESRICFGVAYFKTEAEATAYSKAVIKKGHTYNGGFFHGMGCGREKQRDYVDPDLGQLYAVTTR